MTDPREFLLKLSEHGGWILPAEKCGAEEIGAAALRGDLLTLVDGGIERSFVRRLAAYTDHADRVFCLARKLAGEFKGEV